MVSDIYSVAAVRAIDRAAIDEAGISGYTLMARAGEAALHFARNRYPEAKRWQVVCGAGNNAGDGYVVARLAAQHGILVSVVAVGSPEKLAGDAEKAWMDFAAEGGECVPWAGELDIEADLLIDALIGSGLDRDLEGDFRDAVLAMNRHRAPVVALDIPSGINGDSGAVQGTAVRADATITFVGLKSGLFLGDGQTHAGTLHFDDLDIPSDCRHAQTIEMRRISSRRLKSVLPRRPRNAHKGDFGHAVVVGGGPGMPGASLLCGEAALRCGAGRVSIATHPQHASQVAAARPELMCHAIDNGRELRQLLERATVVAIGPGLGTGDWSRDLYDAALDNELPKVVDADALNLLAASEARREDWILTPHPGEAGRLLGKSGAEVQSDRRAALIDLQKRYGGTVVLKGAGTLISADDGVPWLCDKGNPGMAAPGMGDVLTGVVVALLAQGLSREQAAMTAAYLHARAGDVAARHGERGILASDLMPALHRLVNP